MRRILQHPLIGEVVGEETTGVTQFLGVKYALLMDRMSAPQLVEYRGIDTVDATVIGYVSE